MPGDTPFDAALAALDVEPRHDAARMVTTYDILGLDAVRAAHRAEIERAVAEERARFLDADLVAALTRLTDDERAVLPLNVQEDARSRVKLAHIEADEGAAAGQGTAVVSVPAKYARLAWAMVCAINAAIRARGGEVVSEPIKVWLLPDMGGRAAIQADARPFDDPRWEEYAAIKRTTYDALSARVAKLEAALRFYASQSSWAGSYCATTGIHSEPDAYYDKGAKARAALEEPK